MEFCSDRLQIVLTAAAKAPGNQPRFLQAGLINREFQLTDDWQRAFSRLQPLDKAVVRSQPGDFLAQAQDVVYRGKTSGSTSCAFTYFAGQQWNEKRTAARQRSLAGWGIDEHVPVLNLASRLSPVRSQDASLMGAVDAAFLDQLRQVVGSESAEPAKPIVLRGYPSRLCEVAVVIHYDQGLFDFSGVVAVVATGECLFEAQKSLLEKTFQAPVINEYGSQESGISGLSCPEEGRLHLDGDRCLYEVIQGELLTTDLYNTTLPMVRYRNGDRLQLDDSPCSCGRSGPTARVLGRQEEAMVIGHQHRWPGEIELPSFPGILAYQLQIWPQRRRLWIQPELKVSQPIDQSLKDWLSELLGPGDTEVLVESPLSSPIGRAPLGAPDLKTLVDSATWIEQVRRQAWSGWLSQPLPMGEAEAIAHLLKQLVLPRYMVAQGLPAHTLALVKEISDRDRSRSPQIEAIKIRTLLWATGLTTTVETYDSTAFYRQLLARTQQWAETTDSTKREQWSVLGFDLLAPLLTLETQAAIELWPTVVSLIQHCWNGKITADAFTVHHYLAILELAGQRRHRQHPWMPALKPLSAMLLGDFYGLVSAPGAGLSLKQVALWAEMVHGLPGAFSNKEALPEENQEREDYLFYETWRAGRRALLRQDAVDFAQQIEQMVAKSSTPAQVAQCWLEKGYGKVLFKESFDIFDWIEVLRAHLGVSTSPANVHLSESSQPVINPLPWLVILRTLAPQLMAEGQPRLAYACLFAAAPPNRHLTTFDRHTYGINEKQSAIRYSKAPGSPSLGALSPDA
jgi:phenylacetate-CoA ligase